MLGVLCVLNVLAGNGPDSAAADPWILRWEGWVLGQTALPAKRKGAPRRTRLRLSFGNRHTTYINRSKLTSRNCT